MDHKFNPSVFEAMGPLRVMSLRFALVKYGAGIVAMSGSIAGNVHARNRFGNYIRPRTKPVNPHSERQESARTVVSHLAERWHADLDKDQRGLWGDYAAAVGMTNRLGETIHLTGFNHYIRSNAANLMCRAVIKDDAPSVLSLPEKDIILQCTEESIADQEFTFTFSQDGWAPNVDPKLNLLLYQGRPQLASRNFYATPWRYMGTVTDGDAGAGNTKALAAAFPFALGQKVWFQARVMTVARRVSELWALDPRTIELDPE